MSLAELQSRYGSGARLEADELELDADAAGQQRFSLPEGAAGLEVLREAAAADARLRATAPYAAERFAHARSSDLQMAHGTTTMAFIFSGGVLVAVDSRASMGSYISSGSVKKFIPISKYLVGTMAGGAADCSFWERHLAMRCRLHELREGQRISTAAASKLLRNVVYSYRGMGLSMGTMVAGWDEVGGPQLYYVDSDGTRLKGDRFSVGSGSTFAYGVLDEEYRYDMTVAEAVELGKRAIWHATHRDAYSGGCINVYCITAEGWKQYFKGDMNELYYGQYAEERKETDKKHADRKAAAAAAAAAAAGPADVEMRS